MTYVSNLMELPNAEWSINTENEQNVYNKNKFNEHSSPEKNDSKCVQINET